MADRDQFDYYWEQKEPMEDNDEGWEDVYRRNSVNPFYNNSSDYTSTKP